MMRIRKMSAVWYGVLAAGLVMGSMSAAAEEGTSDSELQTEAVLQAGMETEGTAPSGEVAAASEMVQAEEVTEDWMVPVHGDELKDGAYEIDVNSSSSMFQITECTLTVENGDMTAAMTMGGTGYLYVCMGTPEEAAAADETEYVSPEEAEDGKHVFTVSVEALDQALDCAAYSRKKEKWYGRQLCFVAESLPADAFLQERGQLSEKMSLADGSYMAEASLSGGSGRASITSPVRLEIRDGEVTARIEWSSPKYDYMIVAGEKYLPVNTEGNSVFEIPVEAFDRPVDVLADTTAMSKPYEIEYQITYDSDTIQEAK